MDSLCDKCWYNVFDDETDSSYCNLQLDEDEYARLLTDKNKTCRYFRPDVGEYGIVRKQN